jgi:hypothetical protein
VAIEYPGYSFYKDQNRATDEANIIEDADIMMRHLIFDKKIPLSSIVVVGSLQ